VKSPFFKGGCIVPLFGKEGQGEIFGKSKANLKSPSPPLRKGETNAKSPLPPLRKGES